MSSKWNKISENNWIKEMKDWNKNYKTEVKENEEMPIKKGKVSHVHEWKKLT